MYNVADKKKNLPHANPTSEPATKNGIKVVFMKELGKLIDSRITFDWTAGGNHVQYCTVDGKPCYVSSFFTMASVSFLYVYVKFISSSELNFL